MTTQLPKGKGKTIVRDRLEAYISERVTPAELAASPILADILSFLRGTKMDTIELNARDSTKETITGILKLHIVELDEKKQKTAEGSFTLREDAAAASADAWLGYGIYLHDELSGNNTEASARTLIDLVLLSSLARAAPPGTLKSFVEWTSSNTPSDLADVSSSLAAEFDQAPTAVLAMPEIHFGLGITGTQTSPSQKVQGITAHSSPTLGADIASQRAPTASPAAPRHASATAPPSPNLPLAPSSSSPTDPKSAPPTLSEKPRLLMSTEVSMRMEVNQNVFVGGRADFTFGYGKEVDKNFAVVEAKPPGERVQGALYQTMVYMGLIRAARLSKTKANAFIYGVATNSKEYTFVRLNTQGVFSASTTYEFENPLQRQTILAYLHHIFQSCAKQSPNCTPTLDEKRSAEEIAQYCRVVENPVFVIRELSEVLATAEEEEEHEEMDVD